MNLYSFNEEQKERVNTLSGSDYNDLWNSVIFGIYNTKFICPVSSNFSITTLYSIEHQAIDVTSYFGDSIYNIYDGTVIVSKSGCIVGDLDCNGKAGNHVVIKHSDIGYFSSYMHLDSVYVSVGDKLIAGDASYILRQNISLNKKREQAKEYWNGNKINGHNETLFEGTAIVKSVIK